MTSAAHNCAAFILQCIYRLLDSRSRSLAKRGQAGADYRLTRVNRNNSERDRSSPAPMAGPGAGFRSSPSPYGASSSSPYGSSSPFPGGSSYGAGPGSGFSTPGGAGSRSEYSESPFGGGMRSSAGVGQAHDLEQHNDDLLKGLLGKVDVLKNVSCFGRRRSGVQCGQTTSRSEIFD